MVVFKIAKDIAIYVGESLWFLGGMFLGAIGIMLFVTGGLPCVGLWLIIDFGGWLRVLGIVCLVLTAVWWRYLDENLYF